jgi:hypothetical protein
MSALPPKADIAGWQLNVRFVPKADIANSLNYLVGTRTHRWRHGEAERLSGLQINRQLVLGWRLHRQIGGLRATEDAIDVVGCVSKLVSEIWPVRDQSAGGNIRATVVDRRQWPAR